MAAWVWALVSSLTSSAGSPGTSHASAVSRLPAPQTWSRSCSSAAGRATLHHGWMGQRPQRRSPESTKTLGQSSMTAHFRQILLQQEPECHSNIKHWKKSTSTSNAASYLINSCQSGWPSWACTLPPPVRCYWDAGAKSWRPAADTDAPLGASQQTVTWVYG